MFALPLVCFLIGTIYGLFGLDSDATLKEMLTLQYALSSPYTVFHQTYPPATWKLMDPCLLCFGIEMMTGVYGTILFNPLIKPRYFIRANGRDNGDPSLHQSNLNFGISSKSFRKIVTFRHKAKRILYLTILVFYVFCFANYYYWVYVNGRFMHNLRQIIYWGVVYPVYLFYFAFGKH